MQYDASNSNSKINLKTFLKLLPLVQEALAS